MTSARLITVAGGWLCIRALAAWGLGGVSPPAFLFRRPPRESQRAAEKQRAGPPLRGTIRRKGGLLLFHSAASRLRGRGDAPGATSPDQPRPSLLRRRVFEPHSQMGFQGDLRGRSCGGWQKGAKCDVRKGPRFAGRRRTCSYERILTPSVTPPGARSARRSVARDMTTGFAVGVTLARPPLPQRVARHRSLLAESYPAEGRRAAWPFLSASGVTARSIIIKGFQGDFAAEASCLCRLRVMGSRHRPTLEPRTALPFHRQG